MLLKLLPCSTLDNLMPQIKVFTDNNKNYTVTAEGDVIGELAYKNWYSNKAEIIMATEEHYAIENKNF